MVRQNKSKSSFQPCPFYHALKNNPLNLSQWACDSNTVYIKDCKLDLDNDNHKEYTKILLRACIDPSSYDQDLKICLSHRSILGTKFGRIVWTNKCLYPTHKRTNLPSNIGKVSHDEAFMALKNGNNHLPMDLPICSECHRLACAPFGSPSSGLADHRDVGAAGDFENEDLMDDTASSSSSHEEAPMFNQMMAAFNDYMEVCGQEKFETRFRLKTIEMEDLHGTTRKGKILKGAAQGVCAILKTFTQVEQDRIVIYKHLKKSGFIEEFLGATTQMASELHEIVLAYNKAETFPVR